MFDGCLRGIQATIKHMDGDVWEIMAASFKKINPLRLDLVPSNKGKVLDFMGFKKKQNKNSSFQDDRLERPSKQSQEDAERKGRDEMKVL